MANKFPKPLEDLADSLAGLPGIGKRTSERLALAIFEWNPDRIQNLSQLLGTIKTRVQTCEICYNLSESNTCNICSDPSKDHKLICIVENIRQISVILNSGRYNGVFHVLGGRISPLDDVGLEDLNVSKLFERIEHDLVEEIVVATSPDVEGEATAYYLAHELKKRFKTKVTRIALGVPMGSDITFADATTMGMAIETRRPIE